MVSHAASDCGETHGNADGPASKTCRDYSCECTSLASTVISEPPSSPLSPLHAGSFCRISYVMLEDFLASARRARLLSTAWYGLCLLARTRIQTSVSQSQDAADRVRACLFRPQGFLSPNAAGLLSTLRRAAYSHLCLETQRLQLCVAEWFITYGITSGRIAPARGKEALGRFAEPNCLRAFERRQISNRLLVDALLDPSGHQQVAQIAAQMASFSPGEMATEQPSLELIHSAASKTEASKLVALGPTRWNLLPLALSPSESLSEGRLASSEAGIAPRVGRCCAVTPLNVFLEKPSEDILFEAVLGEMEL
jgi:hypothetical protein